MADVPESLTIWLMKPLVGPLLNDSAIAEAFASLILRRLYGEDEHAKQQPWRVTDLGESWKVMGSYQEAGAGPDFGAWFIEVRKSDCRVENCGHYRPLDISDEVKEIIANAKNSQ